MLIRVSSISKRIADIAHANGALLLVDMAHIAGLVAQACIHLQYLMLISLQLLLIKLCVVLVAVLS